MARHILFQVDDRFDDLYSFPRKAGRERVFITSPGRDLCIGHAMRLTDELEVCLVWRQEVAFVVFSVLCDGEMLEDATAAIIDEDDLVLRRDARI